MPDSVDPDVVYDKIVEVFNDHEAGRLGVRTALAEVSELWGELDGWLRQGGFAPKPWDPARNNTARRKGWELVEENPATYIVRLNGKVVTTLRFDGRAGGRWGFYTREFGYEYHSRPAAAFDVIVSRFEGAS